MGHSLQLPLDVEHANNREQYEAWREQLNMRISEFVEEHELTFGIMALLLVDLGISSRMIDYLLTTAKPSGSGLKLDLERSRREIDDYVRGCKRDADDFVRESKEAIGKALLEDPALSGTPHG